MRKTLLAIVLGTLPLLLLAQSNERCSIDAYTTFKQTKDPKYADKLQQAEVIMQASMGANTFARYGGEDLYTIPVVVHVVWRTPAQNISDEQVMSQIDILNKDFQRLNTDTTETPEGFKPVAGSLPIQFCLAQRDPDGNPTTGILRVETTVSSFSTDDDVKFNASGGSDQWDPERYFNIWVCNLTGGLLGYGEFPTAGFSDTYGVVNDYLYFGDIGTASPPYDEGRTATHEVGHCFNLRHIWADDGSGCGASDLVDDTPNQAGENYGCPSFPRYDACTDTGDGVMYMNYMDYTNDGCMNIFTQGQADRMWNAINNFYPELLESDGCLPIELLAHDASLLTVIEPVGLSCENTIVPEITIRNFGAEVLTSLEIEYSIDGGTPFTYTWTGSLASLESTSFSLPEITATEGGHTFEVNTSNPNGFVDLNPTNDSGSSDFSVYTSGVEAPLVEGFESVVFPTTGWSVENNTGGITWERTTAASSTDVAAAWVNNYDYDSEGATDDLVSIPVDLTDMEAPQVSFDVAYTYYKQGSTTYTDAMEVLVTTDCGATFTSVYFKEGEDLSTRSPISASFTPSESQWRKDTIDLSAFAGSTFVSLVFRNITGYGNNLYLDNINIEEKVIPQAITDLPAGWLTVGPVPASSFLQLNWTSALPEGDVMLIDMSGRRIQLRHMAGGASGSSIVAVDDLPSGLYFLQYISDSRIYQGERVMITR
jgi:hypothetical protein